MDTVYDAKLLIVDDNADLLALLCEQLRGAGYGHIRTAQSCAAARACFAAEQPELMILDINLPDGDISMPCIGLVLFSKGCCADFLPWKICFQ